MPALPPPIGGQSDQEDVPGPFRRQQFLARRPTARRPSCSTFRPLRPASTSRAGPGAQQQGWRLEGRRPTSRPSDSNPNLTVADPLTGEIKNNVHIPYPNYSGALSTAGGVVFTGFTDGTFAAYDDTTMEQLWKINVGTGFNAPPMTFEVNGKQYIAILAGLSPIARGKHQLIPELKEQRNQTMLFVFGL